jgi:hypothetical protein
MALRGDRKVADARPALDERLHKAEQALSVELLRRQPSAYSEPSAREGIERIRKIEGGLAA